MKDVIMLLLQSTQPAAQEAIRLAGFGLLLRKAAVRRLQPSPCPPAALCSELTVCTHYLITVHRDVVIVLRNIATTQ